jgi:nucleoside-diphosphate-sugar epimerase
VWRVNKIKPKTISVLGSGWLGLPLAEELVKQSYRVHASTRSEHRRSEIEAVAARPFVIDIDHLPNNIQEFLTVETLVVNITSKSRYDFANLISEIGESPITKVLFVSSTSVYRNTNNIVTESNASEDEHNPLYQIEKLFQNSSQFQTTIVRFAGLFGYSRHPGHFFSTSKVIPQADAPVNLIHRDDCINIISKIIEHSIWDEVLNACASTHPTKKAFYGNARKNLSLPPLEFSTGGQCHHKVVSNEKLKRLLNYNFIYDDLLNVKF